VTSLANLNSCLSPIGAVVAGIGADFFEPQWVTIVLVCLIMVAPGGYSLPATVGDYRLSDALN